MEGVIEVLQAACGQNVNSVKQAENMLKMLEENQGFYSVLLDIFLAKNIDVNIRWMAIICFKNGILKQWRKVGENAMTSDEKISLRQKLMSRFDEEIPQLASQLAVVIGRIVRVDIRQWPQSIQITLQAVKSDNPLIQHRSLLTLNQIIKQLASKRLVTDRKVFQEISINIFNHLYECNSKYSDLILQCNNMEDIFKNIEMLILITKVSRKLLIHGPKDYTPETLQMQYVSSNLQYIEALMKYKHESTNANLNEKLEKQVILIMKILSELQETRAFSFLPVLEKVLKLCIEQILLSTNQTKFPMFTIYCSNLLRTIIKTYKNPKSDGDKNQLMLTAVSIKDKMLTAAVVEKICYHIITNHFPITQEDFEEWSNDPEEYIQTEAGESHKFLLRPCMETLYLGLFYEHKTLVIPLVLNCVKETNALNPTNLSTDHILKLSTVYKAVGLASYEIFDDLDFDVWFETNLMPILFTNERNLLLLRQHIIWMIGEWINVKFSKFNRVKLYDIVSVILTSENQDLVMKLTACKTLRTAIDDFDFVIEDFTPYINNIFISLCNLLMSVELCDTKMLVLNILSVMIERISDKVKDNASMLLQYLPKLWEISEAHNLLRGAVVNVLVHLVKGMDNDSAKFHLITLPIIQYSTSVEQDAHIYLLEDGLELWLSVMETSDHMTQDLLTLYQNIPPLLERATETFDVCVAITKLYLVIDANAFLETYGYKLCRLFNELFDHIKDTATSKITQIIKLSLQMSPVKTKTIFSDCLLKIIDYVIKDENYPPLMIEYITILGYLILYLPIEFQNFLEKYREMNQLSNIDDFMDVLLTTWFDKNDCMGLSDKKISAMSLASLLPHKAAFIMKRFGLILDFCVNVMYDLTKTTTSNEPESQVTDILVVSFNESQDDNQNDVSEMKQMKALQQDPIYTVILVDFIRDKLQETKQNYGDELFNQAMETLDMTVASQLKSLVL